MSDFTVRADSIDVPEMMERIRSRLREKRGVDYTEQEIRELADVKLEKFLDPRAVRSDLLERFRETKHFIRFGPDELFVTRRPLVARIRRLLRPVLRLFFSPDPIALAFEYLNTMAATSDLSFELLHNLVVEVTRLSIAVKNVETRVDALTGRFESSERRARALEDVVVYRPARSDEESADAAAGALRIGEGPGQRSLRLRRRRGRRRSASAVSIMEKESPDKPGREHEGAEGQSPRDTDKTGPGREA